MGYREKSATLDHSVTYTYDAENNLSSMVETVNGVSKTCSYTYDTDNRLISMSVGDTTVSYTYDDFGRVSKRTTKHGETVIEETDVGYNSTASTTSGQIVSYNGYTYTYDGNGNILTISDGTNTVTYEYDTQNQLIWEYNPAHGYAHNWIYDNAGNIDERREYTYIAEVLSTTYTSVEYVYNDSEWGDLLTSYDGRTVTYDTIGNPLNDGTWSYTWQHGRQLASMSSETETWSFTYNADGLRTKRTDGLSSYTYIYDGDRLTRLIVESHEYFDFTFTYDANGVPLTITDRDDTYYYITNLQGDVIGIKDSSGQQVVTYSYDAWGNLLYRTNIQLADYNPLRYRGYVYDMETELYYLQSRYYNPEIGRFINADSLVSTGQGLLGNNMFAYCNNNPVIYVDPTGCFLRFAFEFLDEWLYGTGEKKEYDEDSAFSKKLKRNTLMQSIVNNAYKEYIKTGKKHFEKSCEFTSSDSLDLYLTAQHVSYTIDFTSEIRTEKMLCGFLILKKQTKYVYATVKVTDKYDFSLKDWSGVGNILNNLACIAHVLLDVGKDYHWSAEFVITYKITIV